MSANTTPIFGLTPHNLGVSTGLAANTAFDGTGTVTTVFTAGANGSKVDRVFLQHMGTNVATVVRFFINNGSSNATPANNWLIHEESMLASTASQVLASIAIVWSSNLIIPTGYKLNVTIGTTIASGIMVTAEGSDF